MAAGTGSIIEAVDYNTIRSKVVGIMGPGTGQSGYGQTVLSSGVATGNIVTKAQWDALRYDILNARIHQDGLVPNVVSAVQGQPIKFGSGFPNNQYNSQANTVITNKWELGPGQFVIDAGANVQRTTSWSNQVSTNLTVTFSSVDQARWFFNSGGKIRITSSREGGTSSPQNSSWSSILASAGILNFGGNTPGVNFYNLTNSYQTFHLSTVSGTYYSGNQYSVEVLSNVANNSIGGATVLTFRIKFTDIYAVFRPGPPAFPDQIDGTLRVVVDEIRASGTLQPLGTGPFVISRPNYSLTPLTGS